MSVATLFPLIKKAESQAINEARHAARERFAESGWPTRRMEEWRFTNLRPLIEAKFSLAPMGDEGSNALISHLNALPSIDADRLVFVNGHFSTIHSRIGSLPANIFVGTFADWSEKNPDLATALLATKDGAGHAFSNLNAALFNNGPVVIVPPGSSLERPVFLVFWNESPDASATHLRFYVDIGAGASADIIESWAGGGAGWSNIAGKVKLGEASRLGLYRLQNESLTSFHTATRELHLAAGAQYDGFTLVLGAGLSREETAVRLLGPNAKLAFHGGYLLAERQEATIVANILHEAPNCSTNEVFKGVLEDRAHGVFQGRITVTKAAQKTDARQLNKTVLLGDRAVMDTKPELEIFADDVKCAHGASIGDLDEASLFYLQSRGLPIEVARRMLVEAFVADAIDLIPYEPARNFLKQSLEERLARTGGQSHA